MATELRDGVWRLELTGVNAYLLDGDPVVLVDAGTPWDAGAIREGVRAAGRDLAAVDHVVVTHFDLDHVGALAKLDGLDAPVHMPDPDAGFLTREAAPPVTSRKGLMQRALRWLVRRPDLPVERVADGDEVAGLTAYRTPGHTPGHTAYVASDREVAFLGDLAMADDGALDLPPWFLNYDTGTVKRSVRSFDERAPEFSVAATGHGDPPTAAGRAALSDLASRLDPPSR